MINFSMSSLLFNKHNSFFVSSSFGRSVKINGAEFGEIFGFKQTIKIDLNEKTRVRE
jgi:hypothetical protein